MNQMINNPYIDVRGVYPSYVNGQLSISLEQMIRDCNIKESDYRSISVLAAELYLLEVGIINCTSSFTADISDMMDDEFNARLNHHEVNQVLGLN